jgi:hypothetical protein
LTGAVAASLVVGAALGAFGHAALNPPVAPVQPSMRQALVAHKVFVTDVRHPVEVDAS